MKTNANLTYAHLLAVASLTLWQASQPNSACAQTCVAPPPSLVAWWPADGNASDIQGTNSGTFTNGATYAAGMVGQAFSFNGSNSVMVPDSPSLHFGTGDVTVEGWLNAPPGATYRFLLIKEGGPLCYPSLAVRLEPDGKLAFYDTDAGTAASFCGWGSSRDRVLSTNRLDNNQWHHFAGVRIATGYLLYVDGQLVGIRNETARNGDTLSPLKIGAGGGGTGFVGALDELAIYKRALTSNEVAAIYVAGSAGKCSLGISLYPCLTIRGVTGTTNGVQYAISLVQPVTWIGVANVILTNPPQLWCDPQPATLTQRNYRVVPGPITIP